MVPHSETQGDTPESVLEQAKKYVGELLMIGVEGLELSDDSAAFLSQARIGGVILFAHNYESPSQVAELCNQIQECRTDLPLWIAVDHEGGRVQRFKKGFTRIPEAKIFGDLDSPKLTFDISEMIAKELKAVGINVNFSPVADINTNPKNPVIGARAYGNDEATVTKQVTAMVRGHSVGGVQPCVKHFPGHGDTSVDSHFALPKVDTGIETLMDREFKPFLKAFKSRCHMVMTAHVLVPNLDPDHPATFSNKILRDLLRGELRYNRIIISDDLEMKAITDHYGADQAPRLAIQASCDILIYRSEKAGRAAYTQLVRDLDQGLLDPKVVLESWERLKDLKKEVLMPYERTDLSLIKDKVGTPQNEDLVKKLYPA